MTGALWVDLLLLVGASLSLYLAYRFAVPSGLPGKVAEEPEIGEELPRKGVGIPDRFDRLVRQAGLDPSTFQRIYWLAKLALAVLVPLAIVLAVPVGGNLFLLILLLGILGFFLPDLWLLARRRARRNRVREALSYFLDFLVALLHSGLNLEDAFRRAATRGFKDASHPLAQEAELVLRELDVGRDRGSAFRALAERTGVSELKAVAAALDLGSRLGTSVAETLGAQADAMRARRKEAAMRRIQTALLQSIVPVFLCGVPLVLILMFYPAVRDLWEVSRALRELFGG